MRKTEIWILPSLIVSVWFHIPPHLQIQIKSFTFYLAGLLWGLNEILHIMCLACFKCSLHVNSHCYCVFGPSFLPHPSPGPIFGIRWFLPLAMGRVLLIWVMQSWFWRLYARCSRNRKKSAHCCNAQNGCYLHELFLSYSPKRNSVCLLRPPGLLVCTHLFPVKKNEKVKKMKCSCQHSLR